MINTILSVSLQLCRQYLTLTLTLLSGESLRTLLSVNSVESLGTLLSGESLGTRLDNTYYANYMWTHVYAIIKVVTTSSFLGGFGTINLTSRPSTNTERIALTVL